MIFVMSETENKTAQEMLARGRRKQREGRVLSCKMDKTIVVSVERRFVHPQFKKVVRSFKKLYVHDEKSEAKIDDMVMVEETRPLSKLKRWRLVQVLEHGEASV